RQRRRLHTTRTRARTDTDPAQGAYHDVLQADSGREGGPLSTAANHLIAAGLFTERGRPASTLTSAHRSIRHGYAHDIVFRAEA
ncbi:hypothetical protein PFISCL1PPCAC_29123, partial [Pristionchus fissidentatus]